MNRRCFFLGLLAFRALAQKPAPIRPDSSAWQSIGFGAWTAQEGDIVGHCDRSNHGDSFLLTRDVYQDFQLTFSFWISAGGSSSILLREPKRQWGTTKAERPGGGPHCGCEITIDYHDRNRPTGTIGSSIQPKKLVGGEGRWNEMEIVCRGREVRVSIAGQRINRCDELPLQAGVIVFKIPETAPVGSLVKFQDILISPTVVKPEV